MNAAPAVRNQPPITDTTPVMRNTALSRLQARSESEVPMATMKVTKVVDRGSLSEVPMAMRAPARTRLTEPRTRSKAAPWSMMVSSVLKRALNQRRTDRGVTRRTQPMSERLQRTTRRAIFDEPNISSPPAWLPRPISVCITLRAFFDVVSATTITTPAPTRNQVEVSDGPLSEPIMNEPGSPAPLAAKSVNEARPVRGTPMKLTRSLPAKAMARAKVPISTTTLSTFTPRAWSACINSVKPTRQAPSTVSVLASIQSLTSGVMKAMLFRPLMSRKYTMAVAQMPPNMPIFHFRRLR